MKLISKTLLFVAFAGATLLFSQSAASKAYAVVIVPPPQPIPPVINVPGSFKTEATVPKGANVKYDVTANEAGYDFDLVLSYPGTKPGTFWCAPESGSFFELDIETSVKCIATSTKGGTAEAGFVIKVIDSTAPDFTVPADINVSTQSDGAYITYDVPTATDIVDGLVKVSCSPMSNTTFSIGSTTVTCAAQDSHGNRSEKTFKVNVTKTTTPPANQIPTINVTAAKTSVQVNEATLLTATASGGDGALVLSWSCTNGQNGGNTNTFSFKNAAAGTFKCTAKVTDVNGDQATKEITITVTAAPTNGGNNPGTGANNPTPTNTETTTPEVLGVTEEANNETPKANETKEINNPTFFEMYWWLLGLIVLVVAGGATGGFFVYKKRSNKSTETPSTPKVEETKVKSKKSTK